MDTRRCEHDIVGVPGACIGDLVVERLPQLVSPTEVGLVLRERTVAAADTRPGGLDVHFEPADPQRPSKRRSFLNTKCALAVGRENLGWIADPFVDVDEVACNAHRDVSADRRLPRSHEANEDDMAIQRVRCHGMRSRYARQAPTKSPSASPPNFSRAARASSN